MISWKAACWLGIGFYVDLCKKSLYSQSYDFSRSPVQMWELDHNEGWALKNWCFWPVVWRRLLRVPWTARRSNQSILKEISPEYSLEGLKLMLKLQYFGHLMRRSDSLEKTLMLGKIEGRRRRGWQRLRRLDSITDSMDMSLSKLWGIVKDRDKWILKFIWKCKGPRRPNLEKESQNDRAHTSCFRSHTSCFRLTTRLWWSGLWHRHSERYLDQGNKIESRNKFICIRSIAFWAGYWDYSMGKVLVFFMQGTTVYSPTKEWIKTPLHTICKN